MGQSVRVVALGPPEALTMDMPERFRLDVVYFMTPCDRPGAPQLGPNEYWIERSNVEKWLDEGGFSVVSPLDAESVAEIELTEDQERWLEWMKKHSIDRIRVERLGS